MEITVSSQNLQKYVVVPEHRLCGSMETTVRTLNLMFFLSSNRLKRSVKPMRGGMAHESIEMLETVIPCTGA